jgi:hypothetical protein
MNFNRYAFGVGVFVWGGPVFLLSLLGLSSCSVSSPSASTETDEIEIRMIHASPNSPPLSLVVGGLSFPSVDFGNQSRYEQIFTGTYDLAFAADSRGLDQLIPAGSQVGSLVVDFPERGNFTVVAVDEPSRVTALILEDRQPPEFGLATVRFVHAVPDAPALAWESTDTSSVVAGLEFSQVSNYVALDPGFTTLLLTTAAPEVTAFTDPVAGTVLEEFDLELEAGKVYSLVATGLLRGNPGLQLILSEEDQASEFL